MGRPPIQLPRVTFRFPEELKNRLQSSATSNGRSLNEEVVSRLDASFVMDDGGLIGREEASKMIREEVRRQTDKEFQELHDLRKSAEAIIEEWKRQSRDRTNE